MQQPFRSQWVPRPQKWHVAWPTVASLACPCGSPSPYKPWSLTWSPRWVAIVGMLGLGELPKFTVKKEHTWNPGDSPNSGFANEKKETFSKSFCNLFYYWKLIAILSKMLNSDHNPSDGTDLDFHNAPALPKCKIDQYGMRLECDRQQLYYFYWSSKSPLKKCWGTQFRPIPIPCSAKNTPGPRMPCHLLPLGPRQRETRE